MHARMAETVQDLRRLEAWLGSHTDIGPCTIVSRKRPLTGFSAETLLLTAATADGRERGVVVRIDRPGRTSFLNATITRQAHTMQALARHGVPVPAVLGWSEDLEALGGPFLVMEHASGIQLPQRPSYHVSGLLLDLDPAGRQRAWRTALATIAQINRTEWRKDFQFLFEPAYGEAGLDHYLGWFRAWRRWAFVGDHPVIDPALSWLDANRPSHMPADLIWGDSNPGNFLFNSDGSVAAVLDFEAAAIGPAEIDLAIWFMVDQLLAAGASLPEGMPDRGEQIAIFEEALGRPVRHLPYFEVLATVRMAIIIGNLAQRLRSLGLLAADNRAGIYNPVASALAGLIGLEHPSMMDDFLQLSAVMAN